MLAYTGFACGCLRDAYRKKYKRLFFFFFFVVCFDSEGAFRFICSDPRVGDPERDMGYGRFSTCCMTSGGLCCCCSCVWYTLEAAWLMRWDGFCCQWPCWPTRCLQNKSASEHVPPLQQRDVSHLLVCRLRRRGVHNRNNISFSLVIGWGKERVIKSVGNKWDRLRDQCSQVELYIHKDSH